MSIAEIPGVGSLPVLLAYHINLLCDRHEAAWRAGRRPRIEDVLTLEDEPGRTVLLRELLAAELAARQAAGRGAGLPGVSRPLPGRHRLDRGGLRGGRNLTRSDPRRSVGSGRPPPRRVLARKPIATPAPMAGFAGRRARFVPLRRARPPTSRTDDQPTRPGGASAGSPGAPTRRRARPTARGRRFRILRPHARGGLGEVFVALDEELHREVALKEIRPEHADEPRSQARFLLEAEITGGLEHPGIVPVYGLGHYADGPALLRHAVRPGRQPQGGHRAVPCRRRPAPRPGRADAGPAQAPAPVHRRLQCARLCPQPGRAAPRPQAGQHHARPLRRDADRRLGPGQGDGPAERESGRRRSRPCGRRWPAIRRRRATGSAHRHAGVHEPGAGGGPAGAAWAGQRRLQPRGDPVLHADRSASRSTSGTSTGRLRRTRDGDFLPPRQVQPEVDAALEAICLKAMARDPRDRYPSALDLAEDLEHWLADEPVSAAPRATRGYGCGVGGDATARRSRPWPWACWPGRSAWGP